MAATKQNCCLLGGELVLFGNALWRAEEVSELTL